MAIRILDYLPRELVRVPMAATQKRAAIEELVDLIVAQKLTADRERLLAAVLEREAQRTTGVGRGLAVPHAKTDACSKLIVAFGRTAEPIEFEAIDRQPVRVLVLIAAPPAQTNPHIQLLARISRLFNTEAIRDALLEAPDADTVYELIRKQDATT